MTRERDRDDERRRQVAEILADGVESTLLGIRSGAAAARQPAATPGRPHFRIVGQRVVSERPLVVEAEIDPAWLEARRRRVDRARGPREPKLPGARSAPVVSRTLATAHRFERQLRRGRFASFSEIAAARRITKARVTQIMDLLLLAPDIQEDILFLPRPTSREREISERDLRPIVHTPLWPDQRRLWRELKDRQRVRLFLVSAVAGEASDRAWGTGRRTRRTAWGSGRAALDEQQ